MQNTAAESSCSADTVPENTDSADTDSEKTDAEYSDSANTVSENIDSADTDSENIDAENSDSEGRKRKEGMEENKLKDFSSHTDDLPDEMLFSEDYDEDNVLYDTNARIYETDEPDAVFDEEGAEDDILYDADARYYEEFEESDGENGEEGGEKNGEGSRAGDDDLTTTAGAAGSAEGSEEGTVPRETGLMEEGLQETGPREKELENTLEEVRKKPGRKPGSDALTPYEEKILRHKRRRYIRTVTFVLILIGALMAAVILWMRRGYRHADLEPVITLSAEDGTAYESLGGNIIRYGSEGAKCIDRRGNILWDVSYEMQQPVTSVSGNVIAIANRSGYYVYVMNTQGLMGTIHTMLPIHSIAASENGEVAVIMNDSKVTWIRLYTAGGKEIAYIVRSMEENGYPIAAAVSPDGKTLCLSSVQMSNTAVKSNVSFYDFGKNGSSRGDHLADYSDFIDEVVPEVRYIDNSTCVGVSDKRLIYFINSPFRPSSSTNIMFSENLQGVFCSESLIGLLFVNTKEDSEYRLTVYNKRGKKLGTVKFTMQFTDIAIAGDKVYIYDEKNCQIFTIDGHCLFNGELGKSIRAMIPGADLSDILVVSGGEIDSVHLH